MNTPFQRAVRDWLGSSGAIFQGTLAATISWTIAKYIVHNHEPFFAPIAAVIALNASLGERGTNALRLLLGVVVGILVGEAVNYAFGREYWSLAIAVFAAMSLAKALGGARIVNAQAAASAILTVVAADRPGTHRLTDALIGAGVALIFTQFLFSPEPTRLLRRAESAVLTKISNVLELTAKALEEGDESIGQAMARLRDLREELSELARVRRVSLRSARHSVVWQRRVPLMVSETENAAHLDLLGVSCLTLARLALAVETPERRLAPPIRELSVVLSNLAERPDDRVRRQTAVQQCLDIISRSTTDAAPDAHFAAVQTAVRLVTADAMVFAGIEVEAIFKGNFGGKAK